MAFNPMRVLWSAGAALALAAALPAQAQNKDLFISIGVTPPGVAAYPQPVYVQPRPVYVQPQPVYVHPHPVYPPAQPVFVQPRPIYVQPAPVYAEPPAYWRPPGWRQPYPQHPHGHHHQHQGRRDFDRDGVPNRWDRFPGDPYRY